jgi:nuclear pore complex protein Nup155
MAFASLQTPQRPLPGAFLNTPAASRYQSNPPPPRPVFRSQPSSNGPAIAAASSSQPALGLAATAPIESISLLPAQRAAKVINEVLARDGNYPDLDSYVKREYLVVSQRE